MGSEESKSQVHHDGDTHVEIINNQNSHTEKLELNTILLWYILVIVSAILGLQIVTVIKRSINKKVTQRARSMLELTHGKTANTV